jgi:hypothetical protein
VAAAGPGAAKSRTKQTVKQGRQLAKHSPAAARAHASQEMKGVQFQRQGPQLEGSHTAPPQPAQPSAAAGTAAAARAEGQAGGSSRQLPSQADMRVAQPGMQAAGAACAPSAVAGPSNPGAQNRPHADEGLVQVSGSGEGWGKVFGSVADRYTTEVAQVCCVNAESQIMLIHEVSTIR